MSGVISPLPRQKAPPRQGHTELICRLITGSDCFAGFAVAFGYKQMLVCSRAGMRVAFASDVISDLTVFDVLFYFVDIRSDGVIGIYFLFDNIY